MNCFHQNQSILLNNFTYKIFSSPEHSLQIREVCEREIKVACKQLSFLLISEKPPYVGGEESPFKHPIAMSN